MNSFQELLLEEKIFCESGHHLDIALPYDRLLQYVKETYGWKERISGRMGQKNAIEFSSSDVPDEVLLILVGDTPQRIRQAEEFGVNGLQSHMEIVPVIKTHPFGDRVLRDTLSWLIEQNIPAVTYFCYHYELQAINR